MSESDRLLDCIESLYAAAADATLWSAALGSINCFLEGPASVLYAVDTSSGAILLWISAGFPDRMVVEYADRWHARDSRHRFNPRNPTPELQYDYMHADEAELGADPFYDWSRHFGLGYYIGGRLHEEASIQVYFFNHRTPRQGHVRDADIERYRRIAPHLANAVTLGLKLGEVRIRAEPAHTLLAALRSGVVILNSCGAILYCNPAAEQILDHRDALASDDRNNLIALRPSDNQRLRTAIATGLRSQEGAEIAKKPHPLVLLRKGGEPCYVVTIMPVTPPKDVLCLDCPAVMLIIDDPTHAPWALASTLSCVFGLTPREAEVSVALAGGTGPGQISRQLGIARTTVDSHLRQIYRKTGTSGLHQALCVLLQSTFGSILDACCTALPEILQSAIYTPNFLNILS